MKNKLNVVCDEDKLTTRRSLTFGRSLINIHMKFHNNIIERHLLKFYEDVFHTTLLIMQKIEVQLLYRGLNFQCVENIHKIKNCLFTVEN